MAAERQRTGAAAPVEIMFGGKRGRIGRNGGGEMEEGTTGVGDEAMRSDGRAEFRTVEAGFAEGVVGGGGGGGGGGGKKHGIVGVLELEERESTSKLILTVRKAHWTRARGVRVPQSMGGARGGARPREPSGGRPSTDPFVVA